MAGTVAEEAGDPAEATPHGREQEKAAMVAAEEEAPAAARGPDAPPGHVSKAYDHRLPYDHTGRRQRD